ncbi:MAG: hypothetical protein ACK5C4_16210, partial [Pseudanabaena sp.]
FIILTRLATDVVFRSSNSHYKNRFFESPPLAGFQKTDFSVSSLGAGNTKIGFIMRIADSGIVLYKLFGMCIYYLIKLWLWILKSITKGQMLHLVPPLTFGF